MIDDFAVRRDIRERFDTGKLHTSPKSDSRLGTMNYVSRSDDLVLKPSPWEDKSQPLQKIALLRVNVALGQDTCEEATEWEAKGR